MKSIHRHNPSRLLWIIPPAIVLVAAGGYAVIASQRHYWPFTQSSTTATVEPTRVASRQNDIDQQKTDFAQQQQTEQNVKNSTGSTGSSSASTTASVIITDAAQYDDTIEVRAYIPDHYEDGTCTITLTNGSLTVSKTTSAYRDAKTTICTNPLIQRSEFAAAGDWSVQVAYSSNGASGTSAKQTVTIK